MTHFASNFDKIHCDISAFLICVFVKQGGTLSAQLCYLSHIECIIYCYEPGVLMYTDTYHYTIFPVLFLSSLHMEINNTGV